MTSRALRSRRGTVAANVTALVVFVLFVFPVYWMVSDRVQAGRRHQVLQRLADPALGDAGQLPHRRARGRVLDLLRNSVMVSLSVTVLAVLVALLAATAVARFRFRGRRAYLLIVLIVQMAPLEALVIPMYLTLRDADLLNLVPLLLGTYMMFVLPFTVWTLRGFIAACRWSWRRRR